MASIEQQNEALKHSLREVYRKAADNERIYQHFQSFEFQLLSTRGLYDLLQQLLIDAAEHFELAACRLLWFDPEYAVQELLDFEERHDFESVLEFVRYPSVFQKLYGDEYTPRLKQLTEIEKARLFPWVPQVESCAMLPLVRNNTIIGSLHWGSKSRSRFSPDKATDFMQHLAMIISVCIENCVSQEHLRRLSLIDVLTRVKNRRAFEIDMSRELSRASRSLRPVSCLFIDIDHFKRVNDTYGHQAGDEALKIVARSVTGQLRQTDHLARYGGEEFAALLPDCGHETAAQIAERVRAAAEETIIRTAGAEAFKVTLSLGVSTWQPSINVKDSDAWVGQRLVAKADSAVYQAKKSGRNRVCFQSFHDENESVIA